MTVYELISFLIQLEDKTMKVAVLDSCGDPEELRSLEIHQQGLWIGTEQIPAVVLAA